MGARIPAGYQLIRAAGLEAVARAPLVPALTDLLGRGTLYDYARERPDRRTFAGRGPVYAVTIGGQPVVVRRARHGGLFAPVTRDLFVGATRAPHELTVSMRLRDAGVATPEVVAYAVYAVAGTLKRADVLTTEIEDAADLLTVLRPTPGSAAARHRVWDAVHALIEDLSRAGAVHADLNVKNVLVAGPASAQPVAYALNVDRVSWQKSHDPAVRRANWARLDRSARKQGLL